MKISDTQRNRYHIDKLFIDTFLLCLSILTYSIDNFSYLFPFLVILTFKYIFWQIKRANVIIYQNWWCWTLFFFTVYKSLLYCVELYFCVFLQFGPHLYFFDFRLDKRRKWWCGVMHVICITPAYHSSLCISNGPSKIAYFTLPNI